MCSKDFIGKISNRKTNAHCIIFQIYFLDLNSVNILWTLKTKETILCVPLDAGLIRNKTITFFIDNTKPFLTPEFTSGS
jgi:hypothetical protein